MKSIQSRSALFFLIKLLISAGLIVLVVRNISNMPEWRQDGFVDRLAGVKVSWLLVATLALAVSMVLNSWQWTLLLRAQNVCVGFWQATRYYFVGLFFNNFMLGNAGGDVKKIYDIRKEHGDLGGGFTATVFDRLFGLFFLNGLSLGVGLLFFSQDPDLNIFLLPTLWVFLGFVAILSALFSRRLGSLVERMVALTGWSIGVEKFASVRGHFQMYRKSDLWLHLIPLSTMIQVLRVLVHFFVAMSLGIHLSVSYFFYFIPIVAVVSALPVSIGGFGPREYTAQTLFVRAGMGQLDSVIVQLLAWATTLVVSLLGALEFVRLKKQPEVQNASRPSSETQK